jgi:hypothetical protein
VAVIEQTPIPTMLNVVVLEIVQTEVVVEVRVTGNPDVAVAVSVNGATPNT